MAIVDGMAYFITSSATGTFISLSETDNTSIIGYQSNDGHNNQRWLARRVGASGVYLQSLQNFQYLAAGDYANKAQLVTSAEPTVFSISGGTTDPFVLHLPQSNFVVDLAGSASANGTPVILFNAHGGANQSWVFTPVA